MLPLQLPLPDRNALVRIKIKWKVYYYFRVERAKSLQLNDADVNRFEEIVSFRFYLAAAAAAQYVLPWV